MTIEEMLESDDWEIFELGLKLKEERDGDVSIVEIMRYYRRIQEKAYSKFYKQFEQQLMRGSKKFQKDESK